MFALKRRQFLQAGTGLTLGFSLGCAFPPLAWAAPVATDPATALPPPAPEIHLLNRIAFGVNPSELARLRAIGVAKYIEEQLQPEHIDDSAVDQAIASYFPLLARSSAELLALPIGQQVQAAVQLEAATVYRAAFSRRQLFEVMVDFWSNHFNIFLFDGPERALKIADDRAVIRAHALGRFSDLLSASAHSPAMLIYLDNVTNTRQGPNENYARELMELHTLGVDGGYTETDVKEVARCFTGWTVDTRQRPGEFVFSAQRHDAGAKKVLDVAIPAGQGIGDGEQVLGLLATHPATARFLAGKLCRRLVSDNPPATLIDKVATEFTASGGDLRNTLRALLNAPEFWAASDQKFKRSLEYIAAVLHGGWVTVSEGGIKTVLSALGVLGQAPFNWQPPNGYPDVQGYWASTNGLLNRWNFAFALAEGRLRGLRANGAALVGSARTPAELLDQLSDRVVHRTLAETDRGALLAYIGGSNAPLPSATLAVKAAGLLGLLLASPYFQLR